MVAEREKVRFVSGDAACVVWHYPGRRMRDRGRWVQGDQGTRHRLALAGPAVRATGHVPGAELLGLRGRHYAPLMEIDEQVVEAELLFRHLVEPSVVRPATASDLPA